MRLVCLSSPSRQHQPQPEYHMDLKTDTLIRGAARQWLRAAKLRHPNGEIPAHDTNFTVSINGGDTVIKALTPTGQGIWKPRQLDACLSVVTSWEHIYDDYFDEPNGVWNYAYRDGDYNHWQNRSLRLAMEHGLEILYFQGISPGLYFVDFVVALGESSRSAVQLGVLPQSDTLPDFSFETVSEKLEIELVKYETVNLRKRLHQAEFRQRVMKAYRRQCAVCSLKAEPLLDAAHIIRHSERGKAEVPNGLSLCKIHHGAYDQNILGISPDYLIHINQDMLSQKDGPMLKHGFQERNQETILIPRKQPDRPDPEKLDQRFEEFKKAS